jgi:hypothetical protein
MGSPHGARMFEFEVKCLSLVLNFDFPLENTGNGNRSQEHTQRPEPETKCERNPGNETLSYIKSAIIFFSCFMWPGAKLVCICVCLLRPWRVRMSGTCNSFVCVHV